MKGEAYAFFAKVDGKWRFEGLHVLTLSAFDEKDRKFRQDVESENGEGTAYVVHVGSNE